MVKDNTQALNNPQDRENNLIFESFASFFESLTSLQRKIFWKIHWFVLHHEKAYPKQQTIAILAKCSLVKVNKTISIFRKKGFIISKKSRYFNFYDLPESLKILNLNEILKIMTKDVPEDVSEISRKRPPHKASSSVKNDLSYTNLNSIRKTNSRKTNKFNQEKGKNFYPHIKEIFHDFDVFSPQDKVQFSKYSDDEITQAFEYFASISEKQEIRNHSRVMQWALKGIRDNSIKVKKPPEINPLLVGLGFSMEEKIWASQFPYEVIKESKQSMSWRISQKNLRTITNENAYFFSILKNKSKKMGYQ